MRRRSAPTICLTDRQDSDSTPGLELRALKRMIGARCEQIERWAREALSRGELDSRESNFQLQVFTERRGQALDQIENDSGEPLETRAARLERLLEALECSRAYFCPVSGDSIDHKDDQGWAVLVK